MKKWLLIIFFWLCWGFALGTVLLLGPVRKTVDFARNSNWGDTNENMAVIAYIVILAVVSFFVARYTAKVVLATDKSNKEKYIHGGIPVTACLLAVLVLMNPSWVNADSLKDTELSTQFTIGPYPDLDQMYKLKRKGFTAVVSLLHPAVVPFEPKLINDEKATAKKAGLEVINIPMLPWVSDNEAAIDSLRHFIRNAKGRYYIHCYLGKDRVNVARRIVEQENQGALDISRGVPHRSLDTVKAFERGKVYKLEQGVYLSPMPTKEEYIGHIIATDVKYVVALTDPAEDEAIQANKAEEQWLDSYKIPYKVFYVSVDEHDERMKQIVDSVKQMPKPVFIHTFTTEDPLAKKLLQAYGE